MTLAKAALFASGVFFGGSIDHAILGAIRRERTPYGIKSGVAGNWLFAAADLALAVVLYRVHATDERRRALDSAPRETTR